MPTLLISGTYGPEDPNRATLPFHIAKGARESGYDVAIALANDAPLIMKATIRDLIQGAGMPALKDLFEFAVSNNIRVYI
jgi:predicted peroxiredoxin